MASESDSLINTVESNPDIAVDIAKLAVGEKFHSQELIEAAERKLICDLFKIWLRSRFSLETLPWIICSILSAIYFYLYLYDAGVSEENEYYMQGFCVTGLNVTDPSNKFCSQKLGNSHQFAFDFDLMFMFMALGLPFTGLCASPFSSSLCVQAVIFAVIIIGHGALHLTFSVNDCNLDTGDDGGNSDLFYLIFIFVLMLIDVFGFSWLPLIPKYGNIIALALAVILTAITYVISVQDQGVAIFFMLSQFVVSFTGWLIPNSKKVTVPLGYAFIFPIVVSLFEFVRCDEFLLSKGGHQWYDVALHISLLISLGTMTVP